MTYNREVEIGALVAWGDITSLSNRHGEGEEVGFGTGSQNLRGYN